MTLTNGDGVFYLNDSAVLKGTVNYQFIDSTETILLTSPYQPNQVYTIILYSELDTVLSWEDLKIAIETEGWFTPATIVSRSTIAGVSTEDKQDDQITLATDLNNKVDLLAKLTDAQPVSDNNGSLTIDSPQLPAALDGLSLKVKEQSPITGFNLETTQTAMSAKLPAALTGSGNLKVSLAESTASQAVTGTLSITPTTGTSSDVSVAAASIAVSTTMSSILAADSTRKAVTIYNLTNRIVYIAIGFSGVATDAATGRFTLRLLTDGFYEVLPQMATNQIYAGVKDVNVSGALLITKTV